MRLEDFRPLVVLFEDSHRDEHGFLPDGHDFLQVFTSGGQFGSALLAEGTNGFELRLVLFGRGAFGFECGAQGCALRGAGAIAGSATAATTPAVAAATATTATAPRPPPPKPPKPPKPSRCFVCTFS